MRLSRINQRHQDAGAATVFVVTFAVVLLVMAGLVVDGGLAINARQRVADDVEQAARAGAQHLNEATLRDSGLVRIEPAAARAAAVNFLGQRPYKLTNIEVTANEQQVSVSAQTELPTALLSLVFIDHFTIRARGQARPAVGITGEDIP